MIDNFIECACGDRYAGNSYGAGFMDANNGICPNCDAAGKSASTSGEPDKPWRWVVEVDGSKPLASLLLVDEKEAETYRSLGGHTVFPVYLAAKQATVAAPEDWRAVLQDAIEVLQIADHVADPSHATVQDYEAFAAAEANLLRLLKAGAPAAVAVHAEWKLVPVEPTLGMQQAALNASRANVASGMSRMLTDGCELWAAQEVYATMLAAAPDAPVTLADEAARLRGILVELVRQFDRKNHGTRRVDAPGHSHEVPGIWDSDNGALAGKPCALCAVWREACAVHDAIGAKEVPHSFRVSIDVDSLRYRAGLATDSHGKDGVE